LFFIAEEGAAFFIFAEDDEELDEELPALVEVEEDFAFIALFIEDFFMAPLTGFIFMPLADFMRLLAAFIAGAAEDVVFIFAG